MTQTASTLPGCPNAACRPRHRRHPRPRHCPCPRYRLLPYPDTRRPGPPPSSPSPSPPTPSARPLPRHRPRRRPPSSIAVRLMLPLLTARPWIRATRPTRHATRDPLDFNRWGCGGGGLQLHLPYARRCRHGHLNLVSHHRHSVEDRAPPACSSLGSPRCGAVCHRRSIALWDLLFLQILLVCSSPMILVRCRGCASGRSLCGWPRCPL